MGHYAQLDSNNKVTNVIVVDNSVDDSHGTSFDEAKGIAFCQDLFGADTSWKKTSYNGTIRGTYAGIGYTYDPANDVFVAPAPTITLAQYNSLTPEQQAQWAAKYPVPTE